MKCYTLNHMKMSIRSIPKMANFRDAVQICSTRNKSSELMSMDKLRYFQKQNTPLVEKNKDVLFRINAIKFNNTWYKYFNRDLQEINLKNFDDFNIYQGMDGKWI